MPKIAYDWQRALYIPLTILAWLILLVLGGMLLGHIVKTILTLVLSGILAFALTPVVRILSRSMPKSIAIAIAYFLGFTIIIGLGALLVYTVAQQVTNLVGNLPKYSHRIQSLEPQVVHILGPFGVTRAKYHSTQTQAITYISSIGTTAASQSLSIVTSILGTIVDIVLVLILSVYLTANGEHIARWLRAQAPTGQRRNMIIFIAIVNRVVGGYIRGTFTLAALIGFLVGGGMLVLHVPYAVLLGVLAFFMEFIPVVGVLVSGTVCVIIALFQGWILALVVLGYFIFVHVIEGDWIGPRIMGRAVGIHPATALVALVAGSELFGIWGALFGSPIAGLLQSIGTAVYLELRGGNAEDVLDSAKDLMQVAADKRAAEVLEDGSSTTPPDSQPGTT